MLQKNFSETGNRCFRGLLDKIPEFNNLGEKITVVGATKTVDTDVINEAYLAGIRDFGENRVREFSEKYGLYPPANLHFIGHLQTNKVKKIVGKVCLIQSVDSERLIEAIASCAVKQDLCQDILIEVNPSRDANKFGFFTEDAVNVCRKYKDLKGISVRGLMAMFPEAADEDEIAKLSTTMRRLYDEIKAENTAFKWLSMGMSRDFETAVKNGSNMIRLGRYLFGERRYDEVS